MTIKARPFSGKGTIRIEKVWKPDDSFPEF